MRWVVVLYLALVALALPAEAQTARVLSGEHDDFTRLVVQLPEAADWTVGRTPMGYAFASRSASQPSYELTRVWDRIPRTRLQALRADPESGALLLTLACPCHVFPFEYQPGMIVLDIKNGAAPAGSSFEAAFTGFSQVVEAPPFAGPARAQPPAYDWLDTPRAAERAPSPGGLGLPIATGTVSLDPLRDELLEQISRGAAQGVVDMALPGPAPNVPAQDHDSLPWSQIRIGDMPGVSVGDAPPEGLAADGGACIAEPMIDLPAWGADQPLPGLLAQARTGLFGEFDRVDSEAVRLSIRLHLFLGFGAEAAQIASLLEGAEARQELQALVSMARLIDGESDPSTPFTGMLGCDGAAALWAALARDRLPPGVEVNTDAILRSFSALPAHLRRTLGPQLAEKLLQRGDVDLARMVRDAVERSPGSTEAEVALLDAKAALQAEDPDGARAHAAASVSGQSSQDGLIALVEAHFQDATPIAPNVAEALLAFQREAGPDATALHRATVLALALSDQTAAAFVLADETGTERSDLWQIAHKRASDDDFLREAVLATGQPPPQARPDTVTAIAERLVDLGFGDAALVWIGPVVSDDPDDKLRVAAQAELLRGDARRTLDLLSALSTPEDEELRARALLQLDQLSPARQAYVSAGLAEEAARVLRWEANWSGLQAEAPGP